ncbi:hypothetical protein EVA_20459 [gut metagenome]|uniref:Uncharacterized protein n=1 Tax=gut metagenome TaxID=749906 RepID=J9FAG8_9ZZZZ
MSLRAACCSARRSSHFLVLTNVANFLSVNFSSFSLRYSLMSLTCASRPLNTLSP